jgi:ADP-ribose pyrophosphatase
MNQFEWLETRTEYREVRRAAYGDELRWILNRETIRNRATGRTVTRAIVRHPGVCVIVPFLAADRIVLLRQYRESLDCDLWELPAGTLAGREERGRVVPTETPDACAIRELREETGYEAERWDKVAELPVMPGSNEQIIHLFFAHVLTPRGQALEEDEAITEVRAFAGNELEGMIARGEIRDTKTLVGLLLALARRTSGLRLV